MAEKVSFVIEVDDRGSPSIRKFGEGMERTARSAAVAERGLSRFQARVVTFSQAMNGARMLMAAFQRAHRILISDFESEAESLIRLSYAYNLPVETLSEYKFIADQANVSLEALLKGQRSLATQMISAAQGATETVKLFKALGSEFADIDKLMSQDLNTTFFQIARRLQEVESSTKKTGVGARLFGRGYEQVMAALKENDSDWQTLLDRLHEVGGVMSTEMAFAAKRVGDEMTTLKAAIRGLQLQFFEQTGILDKMSGGLRDLATQISTIDLTPYIAQVLTLSRVFLELRIAIFSATDAMGRISHEGEAMRGAMLYLTIITQGATAFVWRLVEGWHELRRIWHAARGNAKEVEDAVSAMAKAEQRANDVTTEMMIGFGSLVTGAWTLPELVPPTTREEAKRLREEMEGVRTALQDIAKGGGIDIDISGMGEKQADFIKKLQAEIEATKDHWTDYEIQFKAIIDQAEQLKIPRAQIEGLAKALIEAKKDAAAYAEQTQQFDSGRAQLTAMREELELMEAGLTSSEIATEKLVRQLMDMGLAEEEIRPVVERLAELKEQTKETAETIKEGWFDVWEEATRGWKDFMLAVISGTRDLNEVLAGIGQSFLRSFVEAFAEGLKEKAGFEGKFKINIAQFVTDIRGSLGGIFGSKDGKSAFGDAEALVPGVPAGTPATGMSGLGSIIAGVGALAGLALSIKAYSDWLGDAAQATAEQNRASRNLQGFGGMNLALGAAGGAAAGGIAGLPFFGVGGLVGAAVGAAIGASLAQALNQALSSGIGRGVSQALSHGLTQRELNTAIKEQPVIRGLRGVASAGFSELGLGGDSPAWLQAISGPPGWAVALFDLLLGFSTPNIEKVFNQAFVDAFKGIGIELNQQLTGGLGEEGGVRFQERRLGLFGAPGQLTALGTEAKALTELVSGLIGAGTDLPDRLGRFFNILTNTMTATKKSGEEVADVFHAMTRSLAYGDIVRAIKNVEMLFRPVEENKTERYKRGLDLVTASFKDVRAFESLDVEEYVQFASDIGLGRWGPKKRKRSREAVQEPVKELLQAPEFDQGWQSFIDSLEAGMMDAITSAFATALVTQGPIGDLLTDFFGNMTKTLRRVANVGWDTPKGKDLLEKMKEDADEAMKNFDRNLEILKPYMEDMWRISQEIAYEFAIAAKDITGALTALGALELDDAELETQLDRIREAFDPSEINEGIMALMQAGSDFADTLFHATRDIEMAAEDLGTVLDYYRNRKLTDTEAAVVWDTLAAKMDDSELIDALKEFGAAGDKFAIRLLVAGGELNAAVESIAEAFNWKEVAQQIQQQFIRLSEQIQSASFQVQISQEIDPRKVAELNRQMIGLRQFQYQYEYFGSEEMGTGSAAWIYQGATEGRFDLEEWKELLSVEPERVIQLLAEYGQAEIAVYEAQIEHAENLRDIYRDLQDFSQDMLDQIAVLREGPRAMEGIRERLREEATSLLATIAAAKEPGTDAAAEITRLQEILPQLLQGAQELAPGSAAFRELLDFIESATFTLQDIGVAGEARQEDLIAAATGDLAAAVADFEAVVQQIESALPQVELATMEATLSDILDELDLVGDVEVQKQIRDAMWTMVGWPPPQAQHGATTRPGKMFWVGEAGPELFVAPDYGRIIPSIEARQFGGPVYPNQPYVVGEGGAELAVMQSTGRAIVPEVPSSSTTNNEVSVNLGPVYVTVEGTSDPTQAAQQVAEQIRRHAAPELVEEIRRALQ